MTLGTVTFSKELLFWSLKFGLNFLGVLTFLGTATNKKIYLKLQIFVGVIFFSKTIWSSITDSHLANFIHKDKDLNCYSENTKIASVRLIFKKDERTKVKNYRPVSLLNILSKIYEESAKSRAWRSCVLVCYAFFRSCVLTCLTCLRAYVLTYLDCLRA